MMNLVWFAIGLVAGLLINWIIMMWIAGGAKREATKQFEESQNNILNLQRLYERRNELADQTNNILQGISNSIYFFVEHTRRAK